MSIGKRLNVAQAKSLAGALAIRSDVAGLRFLVETLADYAIDLEQKLNLADTTRKAIMRWIDAAAKSSEPNAGFAEQEEFEAAHLALQQLGIDATNAAGKS